MVIFHIGRKYYNFVFVAKSKIFINQEYKAYLYTKSQRQEVDREGIRKRSYTISGSKLNQPVSHKICLPINPIKNTATKRSAKSFNIITQVCYRSKRLHNNTIQSIITECNISLHNDDSKFSCFAIWIAHYIAFASTTTGSLNEVAFVHNFKIFPLSSRATTGNQASSSVVAASTFNLTIPMGGQARVWITL